LEPGAFILEAFGLARHSSTLEMSKPLSFLASPARRCTNARGVSYAEPGSISPCVCLFFAVCVMLCRQKRLQAHADPGSDDYFYFGLIQFKLIEDLDGTNAYGIVDLDASNVVVIIRYRAH